VGACHGCVRQVSMPTMELMPPAVMQWMRMLTDDSSDDYAGDDDDD
jgi:hypothetical protein